MKKHFTTWNSIAGEINDGFAEGFHRGFEEGFCGFLFPFSFTKNGEDFDKEPAGKTMPTMSNQKAVILIRTAHGRRTSA